MDAAALLKSQGWRGKGHSLHPTSNAIGLSAPLLLSRNTDGRGIGQKPHFTSDQWWLSAFDQKLKGLDTSKKGVVQSVTSGALDAVASGNGKYSGTSSLYASFVRGEVLGGTITPDSTEESTDATPTSDDRESVSNRPNGLNRGTKEERRARKEARGLRRVERAERRARKKARREARESRKLAKAKEERRARRAERRARKEERRKRRLEKEERKAAKG